MERRVKERLVGAAVLVAAAVILIPEMLSGPRRSEVPEPPKDDAALKTYTIDLNRSSNAGPVSTPLDERAPPAEIELPTVAAAQPAAAPQPPVASPNSSSAGSAETQAKPETGRAPATTRPPQTASAREAKPREVAPTAPQTSTSSPTPRTPPASAAGAQVPSTQGWAVQAGSFSSRATADRLTRELSAAGHRAFVMPVKANDKTLYRVRIGPFADRAAANEALTRVRKRVANAAVVAHP